MCNFSVPYLAVVPLGPQFLDSVSDALQRKGSESQRAAARDSLRGAPVFVLVAMCVFIEPLSYFLPLRRSPCSRGLFFFDADFLR